MPQKKIILELTPSEAAHMRGALFLGQQHSEDEIGRRNPSLTRVQVKLDKAITGADDA